MHLLPGPLLGCLLGLIASPVVLGADNTDAIPQLSGHWTRSVLNLAPPPIGPGPILNMFRNPNGTINDTYRVGDFRSPLLKPEAAEVLRKHGEMSLSGMAIPDPHNQCWPEPPGFASAIEMGMQLLQRKDEVVLISLTGPTVRHIRLNVSHAANLTPTWLGDSVGYYDGDTLVIDTIGIKAGPLAVIDRYGTPFSGALHVVERYRLIEGDAAVDALRKQRSANGLSETLSRFDGYGGEIDLDTKRKGLQGEITIEDPGAFTMTWSGIVTYQPGIGAWPEVICAESLSEPSGLEKRVPLAEKPDF
jgi:hypothetical protein